MQKLDKHVQITLSLLKHFVATLWNTDNNNNVNGCGCEKRHFEKKVIKNDGM